MTTRGFSLIELMIAVAVLAILGTIAYPSYTRYITISNRTEAQRTLMVLANKQEEYYLDHKQYADAVNQLGYGASASYSTDSGYYLISATASAAAATFTLTATAQGNQATRDSECASLSIDQNSGRSALDGDGNASSECWE